MTPRQEKQELVEALATLTKYLISVEAQCHMLFDKSCYKKSENPSEKDAFIKQSAALDKTARICRDAADALQKCIVTVIEDMTEK